MVTSVRGTGRHASRRSASAQRAHAAGDVMWVLDLATGKRTPAANASARTVAGLVVVALGIWGYNAGLVLTHLHR